MDHRFKCQTKKLLVENIGKKYVDLGSGRALSSDSCKRKTGHQSCTKTKKVCSEKDTRKRKLPQLRTKNMSNQEMGKNLNGLQPRGCRDGQHATEDGQHSDARAT